MRWWTGYSAIFFDLDGLLLNTEELHWKAYYDMCRQNNVVLPWTFDLYYSLASRSANGVRLRLQAEFPQLFEHKSWDELYLEKKAHLRERFDQDVIPLMPGASRILSSLASADIPIAVVSHSSHELIDRIKGQHSEFSVIQRWFGRESYLHPKPAPDGYLFAAHVFGVDPARCLGFEDSLRGIEALSSAGVIPILVQKYDQEARAFCMNRKIRVLTTIDEICQE